MMSSLEVTTSRRVRVIGRTAGWLPSLVDALPAVAVAAAFLALWVGAALLLPHGAQNPDTPIFPGATSLQPLVRFDGYFYATIAGHGYVPMPGRYQLYAFFPLLPGLAAALHGVIPLLSVPASGLAVNGAAVVGAAVLIDRTLASWSRGRRLVAVAVVLSLPSAFFYATFYSEPLLLLATALTVWALADQRRSALVPVGVLLATLDRPPGALLLLLVLAVLRRRGYGWRSMIPSVVAVGVAVSLVMVVDMLAAGDPFAFVHAQAGWTSLRTLGFADGARWVLTQSQPAAIWQSVVSFGYWDLYLAAAALVVFRRRLGAAAPYAAAVMVVCFLAGGVGTQSRYLVTLLPFWLGLLELLSRRGPRTWMLTTGLAIAGGIAMNLWMLDRFVRGIWAG